MSTASASSSASTSSTSTPHVVSLPRKIVYSGLSGAIATTIIYPIDLTKTKLMNQKGVGPSREFFGPIDCVRKIVAKEGIRGMYRGWPPNVIFVMPEKAIKLTANDMFRERLASLNDGHLTFLLEMAAGGMAGFCQVVITNPMELLKIQGATMVEKIKQGELKEKIPYTTLMRQLRVSGLYTGVLSTLLRDVPFSMVYFSLYAQTKTALLGSHTDQSSAVGVRAFLAGAIAGTVAAAATCPVDVIKTRVHANAVPLPQLSFGQFLRRECVLVTDQFWGILKKEGSSSFFKGIIPRCLIISPLFAITMTCYEKFQQVLG